MTPSKEEQVVGNETLTIGGPSVNRSAGPLDSEDGNPSGKGVTHRNGLTSSLTSPLLRHVEEPTSNMDVGVFQGTLRTPHSRWDSSSSRV